MRRLLLLAPILAALTGCNDGLYYQTRYIPTDIDSSFTIEALTWNGDREVIELPASPPDLEATNRPRVECAHPYQKFKSGPIVNIKKEGNKSTNGVESSNIAVMSSYQRPTGPNTVMAGGPKTALYANSPYAPGVTQHAFPVAISDTDRRPHSTTGVGTNINSNLIKVNGGMNSNTYNPYCLGTGPGTGTTNVGLGPGR